MLNDVLVFNICECLFSGGKKLGEEQLQVLFEFFNFKNMDVDRFLKE